MKVTLSAFAILLLATPLSLADNRAPTDEDAAAKIYQSLPSCDQAVFVGEQSIASSSRMGNGSQVDVVEVANPKNDVRIYTPDRAVDLKIQDGVIYILTGTTLQAWSIPKNQEIFSYATSPQVTSASSDDVKASGFVLSGGRAVIAHGLAGFSVLDLSSGRQIQSIPMLGDSRAVDVALVDSTTAVAAVDDNAEGAFHGMYLIDLNSLQITQQIKIDNVYPSAVRVLEGNRLMMIYFNAVWKFDLSQSLVATEAQPQARVWQFPGVDEVDMVGKVAFGQKYLYACIQEHQGNGSLGQRVPTAIELSSIGL